jgi:hypothetical protein
MMIGLWHDLSRFLSASGDLVIVLHAKPWLPPKA